MSGLMLLFVLLGCFPLSIIISAAWMEGERLLNSADEQDKHRS